MPKIMTMGELLCEIMRPGEGMELYETGDFKGPFPSGAPGIFISTAARLGCSCGIIAGVGNDDFGKNIMDRLSGDGVDCRWIMKSDKGSTGVAFVTYYANGDRKFIFHMNHTPAVEPKAPEDLEEMEDTEYFHIMGCSLMASVEFGREILKTMDLFEKRGAKISFDPNVRLELLRDPAAFDMVREAFRQCHIFMPGVQELKMLTGKENIEEAVSTAFENENGRRVPKYIRQRGLCWKWEFIRLKRWTLQEPATALTQLLFADLPKGRDWRRLHGWEQRQEL